MPGPTVGAQLYAGDGVLAFVAPDGTYEGPTTGTTWSLWLAGTDPRRWALRTDPPA